MGLGPPDKLPGTQWFMRFRDTSGERRPATIMIQDIRDSRVPLQALRCASPAEFYVNRRERLPLFLLSAPPDGLEPYERV